MTPLADQVVGWRLHAESNASRCLLFICHRQLKYVGREPIIQKSIGF
jgi:hypothetical protein